MSLTLVIGGTRSGKSAHAERLARSTGTAVRYLATADPADASMAERIARHVARRPEGWQTVVARDQLAGAVAAEATTLLDGLGVWLAGALHRGLDTIREIEALIEAARADEVIVVAEQAGEGLMAADGVSRAWLDALGEATQRLSRAASRVDYVIAGRVLTLHRDAVAQPLGNRGEFASLRRHGDRDVRPGDADHAVNVLAGGPPPWLRAALDEALDAATAHYPDEGAAAAAIASLHGRAPEEIIPTNGAAEALWILAPALAPRLAACVHPGFTEAEAGLRAHGIPVVRVQRRPEEGFRLDPAAVPAEADLVVVGNPASPSGTPAPAGALLALRAPGRTLVVDEAFMSMLPGEPGSLAAEPLDGVIVIRSLTKLLSIPGLRAGYAIAGAELAARLRAARPPWSANALALAALGAAGSHPEELLALAERAQAEREDLERRLRAIRGVRVWPSATNFCLIEVPDGAAVTAALRRARIAVRPAGSFPGLGPGHLRITARDPDANAALAAALEAALA